ncbi:MAG: hypothetical protein P8Z36_12980 [Gemmatimonadota bacterium]|jgi:hypothetical protein
MHMKRFVVMVVGLVLLGVPAGLAGQAWETPSFLPPRPGNDAGLYLTNGDGYDLGLAGLWRSGNLGVRVDFFDTNIGSRLGVGAETHGFLLAAGPDFPVDVSWTAAGGIVVGNGLTSLWIPAGVSIGRTFELQQISVQPYLHPRIGLSANWYNGGSNADLNAVLEFGSDIYLNKDWTFRVAFDVGDYGALGIGAAYHISRGMSVR